MYTIYNVLQTYNILGHNVIADHSGKDMDGTQLCWDKAMAPGGNSSPQKKTKTVGNDKQEG